MEIAGTGGQRLLRIPCGAENYWTLLFFEYASPALEGALTLARAALRVIGVPQSLFAVQI